MILGFALSSILSWATVVDRVAVPSAVQVEGVISFSREVTFRAFSVTQEGASLKWKGCVNGIFQDRSKLNIDETQMEGRRVVAEGFLLNYVKYASSDPLMATVSSLQNSCGNENFILISSVKLKV